MIRIFTQHLKQFAQLLKRGSKMNSALRNQILADRRRDRRNDIIASVIGWTVTIATVLITLPVLYVGLVFIMTMA